MNNKFLKSKKNEDTEDVFLVKSLYDKDPSLVLNLISESDLIWDIVDWDKVLEILDSKGIIDIDFSDDYKYIHVWDPKNLRKPLYTIKNDNDEGRYDNLLIEFVGQKYPLDMLVDEEIISKEEMKKLIEWNKASEVLLKEIDKFEESRKRLESQNFLSKKGVAKEGLSNLVSSNVLEGDKYAIAFFEDDGKFLWFRIDSAVAFFDDYDSAVERIYEILSNVGIKDIDVEDNLIEFDDGYTGLLLDEPIDVSYYDVKYNDDYNVVKIVIVPVEDIVDLEHKYIKNDFERVFTRSKGDE